MNRQPLDSSGDDATTTERGQLRQRLQALPDTPPPRAVWQRIERQARAEGLIGMQSLPTPARWLAVAAVAAVVVVAVLGLSLNLGDGEAGEVVPVIANQEPGSEESERFPTVPAYNPPANESLDSTIEATRYLSINALMVQSQLLEADLRRLPHRPEVARAGTLATVADLESRVGAIDHRLNDPQAKLDTEQQQQLWRERVRLMDSLLSLRYAQSRRFSF